MQRTLVTGFGFMGAMHAQVYRQLARRIPVRRLGQPLDIAQAAAFLLSDEAGYINGTSLVLDGGTMVLPPW